MKRLYDTKDDHKCMNNYKQIQNNGIYRLSRKKPKNKKKYDYVSKEYRKRKARDRKSTIQIDYSTFKGEIKRIAPNKSGIVSKKKKKPNKYINIEKYSEKLNNNVPKSEVWFRERIEKEWFFNLLGLKYNYPFKRFIYDAYSSRYQIAIEIDGSIHDTFKQKKKDNIKNRFTAVYGLKMIRIVAYNNTSYLSSIKKIEDLLRTRNIEKEVAPIVVPILKKL